MSDNGSLRRPKSCVNPDTSSYLQRSFAHLNVSNSRSSPIESRKQVISQIFEPTTPSSIYSSNSNIFHFTPSWYDIVDNKDFEHSLDLQEKETENESEVIQKLARYPNDDIEVKLVKRECRTETPVIPDIENNASSHLINCFQSFTDDWSVIEHKYANSRSGILAYNTEGVKSENLKVHEYEESDTKTNSDLSGKLFGSSSSSDLNNCEADSLISSIFDNISQEEIDDRNAKERSEQRPQNLFSLLPSNTNNVNLTGILADEQEMPIEHTVTPPMPKEHFGYRILVKCLSLELEVEIEPIFVSLALYDIQNKKKVSETFYFDVNKDHIKKLLKENIQPDIPTLSRSAIFSVTYPSNDVFLVIRLEKVLQQGDASECIEPYMKDATDKCREKAKNNAHWFCEKLHKYRMPFAWTAIHLMNVVNKAENLKPMEETTTTTTSTDSLQSKSGTLSNQTLSDAELNMLTSFKAVTITVSSFFKQENDKLSEDDLFKYLQDLRRPSKLLKGLKCIPVKLKLDVSPCPNNFSYCLTPELVKVIPYPDQRGRPTREILEFPPKEVYIPNTIYRNLMYVYPQSVNFNNRPGHARNIAIKVQLMSGEESDKALKAIFGKSSCEEISKEAYCSVLYHSKTPDFYDEIKIKLPANLSERYHLLFTFYHISCQKKQDMTPIETLVGYSWLPLLQNGHLRVGDVSLPVSMDKLPPNYSLLSSESSIPGIKWVDNRKPVFSLSIKCVSTVHTMDRHLDGFFNVCNAIDRNAFAKPDDAEQRLRNGMLNMGKNSQLEALVHFLYIVLNKIVNLLIRPPVVCGQTINVGQTCFETICLLTMKIHKSLPLQSDIQGRNTMLASYAHYVFRPDVLHSKQNQFNDDELGTVGGNHYATISKAGIRHRPTLSSETFNLSSSNPDLSSPTSTPDQSPTQEKSDESLFLRHSNTRSSLMEQSEHTRNDSTGVRSITRKVFHEEIALLWVVSTGYVKENALQQAWFLFDLMHKSMAHHLNTTNNLNTNRVDCFPVRYLDDMSRLVKIVTAEIINNYSKNSALAEHLNMSLAFFLRDILSIMNRGFVFQLITSYSQLFGSKIVNLNSPAPLMSLRLSLMRIICSHEHYVTLNLPFLTPRMSSPTPSITSTTSALSMLSALTTNNTDYDVTDQFVKNHFLVGILLADLQTAVEMGETASVAGPQLYAVTNIMNLMKSHDADDRISASYEVKEKVASLYMPLLMIAIKALSTVHEFSSENFGSSMSVDTSTSDDSGFNEPIDPKTASAISSSSIISRHIQSPVLSSVTNKMSPEATKNLLICVLWLLKNCNQEDLKNFILALGPIHVNNFLELLYIAISCFEYKTPPSVFSRGDSNRSSASHKDKIDRLSGFILGDQSARTQLLMRRKGDRYGSSLSKDDSEKGLRWRKDRTEYKINKGDKSNTDGGTKVTKELSAESTILILDALELVIDCATEMGNISTILTSSLKLLLHCLSTNQSTAVLELTFATQRSMIARFPELIFEEEIEQCADLCLALLKRCSSNCGSVRRNATASLYLLMRHNFSVGNTFARVKMQITMSLSSLVGMSTHNFDEDCLRRSLKTILMYAENDNDLSSTSFPEQVQDLMYNLHTILCDTVKMKEHQEDPEMLIDLMYRIAKGYQNSPDLRLTWLQNMAQQHQGRKNHVEAGMCLLHSAALVAEYLSMIEEKSYLPIGCISFKSITPNILEESAVSDDVVSPHEDGVCTEKYFSLQGFLGLLESASVSFQMAGVYEVVNDISKLLVPVYEHLRDNKKLASIHTNLNDCFTKIKNQDGKRMFGTYFRIAFYGSLFGDLDKEEFIYKEPGITKLPEISHRLQHFYGNCFGENNLEVVKDSKTVDTDKLDPNKAYIQITYVEPYFLKWEEERKQSYFESNFNIRRFIYSTPYTLDGKAHGAIKDQYKKKTILEVTHAFPYMKTRNKVIKRKEIILTPLETACEDVKKKSQQLLQVATQQPVDVRMLQVNLQGSVLTTVNQGPLEVAFTFLTEIPEDPKMWIPFNKLRLAFRDFDYACNLALKRNKSLISSDQKEYQRELERNYNKMTEKLKPLYKNRQIMQMIRGATHKQLGFE